MTDEEYADRIANRVVAATLVLTEAVTYWRKNEKPLAN